MADYRFQHPGGCACGAITYFLHCNQDLDELTPRACQCEFCLPRAASYVSAAGARLEVRVRDLRYLYAHVFGTYTADFMHCGRCNHLVYVSSEIDGRVRGLVLAQSLRDVIDAPATGTHYDDESLEQRLARRAATWIPELVVLEQG